MDIVRRLDETAEARKDLNQAAILGQMAADRKKGPRRLRLGAQTGDEAIPAGSSVHFEPTRVHGVKRGSLVLVRVESDVQVRRLLSVSPGSAGMQIRVGPPAGSGEAKVLPGTALVGRVLGVEHGGKMLRLGGGPLGWLGSLLRRLF